MLCANLESVDEQLPNGFGMICEWEECSYSVEKNVTQYLNHVTIEHLAHVFRSDDDDGKLISRFVLWHMNNFANVWFICNLCGIQWSLIRARGETALRRWCR